MNYQFFVLRQTYIQLEHMHEVVMLPEYFQCVLRPLPGPSSVTDAEYFVRLYQVVKWFVAVFHSFVKNIWEQQKNCGD